MDVAPRLEELRRSLEALLSAFEGERAAVPEALELVWHRSAEAFERFREAHEGADDPLPPELRAEAERVLRLHAVALSVAARHREELIGELGRVAGARSRLRGVARANATGGSCDVSG